MLDASGTSTYTYDHADRLNVVTNGYGQSVSYSYSGINQRLTLQDPSLATFSYTYDAARRLSTVVNPQNSRTTFTYDLADRRMLAHNGNGTSTSYVYDAADRLLWLNHFGPGSAGIAGFTYTYDNVGNPQSVLELDGSTVDWTNDGANQLILEDRTGTDAAHRKNYYDGRGNRFEQDLNSGLTKVNGFTYDNADQLKVLTSYNLPAIATLTSYTYDPAGNLLGVLNPPGTQPTTFVWDDEGRSKLVQLPTGVSVTSTFNGDNLRMQRVDNTGTVRYVWDSQAYLAETDGSNVMQAEYTQEPAQYGGLLSQYRLTGGVWTPSYYHFDRIGSTRALTSSSGSITDTYFYEAFGTSLGGSGSTVNPFQFIGQLGYYRDAASGLYYVRDRVYDPVTGRWVSRDRIGFASGDPNPHRYVWNNPTFYIDPSGMWRFVPGMGTSEVWLYSTSDGFKADFRLSFLPDMQAFRAVAGDLCNIEVRYMQIVRLKSNTGTIAGQGGITFGKLPLNTWFVDGNPPYYPTTDGKFDPFTSGPAVNPRMDDEPGIPGQRFKALDFSFEGETVLVSIRGSSDGSIKPGDVYTDIQWGFSFSVGGTIFNKHVTFQKYYVNNLVWDSDSSQKVVATTSAGQQHMTIGGPSSTPPRMPGYHSYTASAMPSPEMQKVLSKYFP